MPMPVLHRRNIIFIDKISAFLSVPVIRSVNADVLVYAVLAFQHYSSLLISEISSSEVIATEPLVLSISSA